MRESWMGKSAKSTRVYRELEKKLGLMPVPDTAAKSERNMEEMVEEILTTVRGLAKSAAEQRPAPPSGIPVRLHPSAFDDS